MSEPILARDIVVLLAVATGALLAGRTLRLPAIVTYLVGGVLVGPGVLGWVTRSDTIGAVADAGVALLLFGVGIEFSLERLRRILPQMLVSGALQVTVTIAATAGALHAVGTRWPTAVFMGFLVALSSTAIVLKLLSDAGELDAPQGQAAAGILLFQDLAIVPMMLLVPVLAHPPAGAAAAAGLALVKAAVALGVLVVLARAVLPRGLALVARAGTPELFPLAALVTAFGTALCAVELGLSLPIGTFLAGLALSGSPYAHQVFAELLPLRDAFVAVFFTSIGMLLDPGTLAGAPVLLATTVGLVALKGVICGVVVALVWRSRTLGILVALALAQIGEFAFVVAAPGTAGGLLPPLHEGAFLGAAILSMAATPFLVALGRRAALVGAARPGTAGVQRGHVLVLGYGTTGQAVARVLRETGIPFVAVDLSAPVVEEADAPVHFGDASRRGVLEDVGGAGARAAVVTVGEPGATRRIVSLLRQMNPDVRIIVRVQRVAEIDELERLGADEVVPSEFETSIELFTRLLVHLGVPRHVVRIQEGVIRLGNYQALRGGGTASAELMAKTQQLIAGGIIESARVMEGSAAAGRTLGELGLAATVLVVVRADAPLPTPDATTRLAAGDLVVLFGPHEAIDRTLRVVEAATRD